jgi:Ca2+-binding RTX toxin-like protein
LVFQELEERFLRTVDLAISGFSANGTDLVVNYNISGSAANAFNIGVYRSSDATSLDALLTSKRIDASSDLSVGSHSVTIQANFTDPQQDYFLLGVLDSSGEVSEASETNNTMVMSGGVFVSSGGIIEVQGGSAADNVSVSSGSSVTVTCNTNTYSYAASTISGIHVRTHAGDDTITMDSSLTIPLWAFGGDGDDTITGGAGADFISGGAGNDYIDGGAGNDVIYGDAGMDWLVGGDGDDQIYGGSDFNTIEGGAGDDTLVGGADGNCYMFSGSDSLGTDTIIAVDGAWDVLDFSGLTAGHGVSIDIGLGGYALQHVNDELSIRLSSDTAIQTVVGTDFDDVILGNSRDNSLFGRDGNDLLVGRGGSDYLSGDAGNDTIYGGYLPGDLLGPSVPTDDGADTIIGGCGIDSIHSDADDYVADNPSIIEFTYQYDATHKLWSFAGQVIDDDDVTGLTVYFGGILSGRWATVDSTGAFTLSVAAAFGVHNIQVSASTIDNEGLWSNVAVTEIT